MIRINDQSSHQRRFFGFVLEFVSISAAGIDPDCALLTATTAPSVRNIRVRG
jgi:hypothetical protein